MVKRVLNIKVLPGQPTDGSGRACIHLFVRDERGPFVEPCVMDQAVDDQGEVVPGKVDVRPTRGRLACDPRRTVAPVTTRLRGGVESVALTMRSDDPRAVTCHKCVASDDYAAAVARIEQAYTGGKTEEEQPCQ